MERLQVDGDQEQDAEPDKKVQYLGKCTECESAIAKATQIRAVLGC